MARLSPPRWLDHHSVCMYVKSFGEPESLAYVRGYRGVCKLHSQCTFILYEVEIGPIEPVGGAVTGADGSLLAVMCQTRSLDVTWDHASCRVSFLVLGRPEGVTGILGMDALSMLHAQWDSILRLAYLP